jgi:hypothetical protein
MACHHSSQHPIWLWHPSSLKPTPSAIPSSTSPSSFGTTAPAVIMELGRVLLLALPQAIFTPPCSVALHFSYINNYSNARKISLHRDQPTRLQSVLCTKPNTALANETYARHAGPPYLPSILTFVHLAPKHPGTSQIRSHGGLATDLLIPSPHPLSAVFIP